MMRKPLFVLLTAVTFLVPTFSGAGAQTARNQPQTTLVTNADIEYMSAMKSAYEAGLRPAMHSDSPVAPVDPLFNMWAAVNRKTSSGRVVGAGQAITPEQALAAYTITRLISSAWKRTPVHLRLESSQILLCWIAIR